ncbi:MAG: hypothetical protein CL920_03805 [Deltaproteobacteria bacterium]|nr:hypothetical protein [Deltaproteobacteria bacterium]|tara:strand:- start:37 stop:1221 length:1185 start_codon:yes stop_codon:yes gene_type:complete
MSDMYTLQGPTEWRTNRSVLSYSSLKVLERCPLQWQLERSRYGDFERFPSKPSEATEVGTIVHEVLEVLFKALKEVGFPKRRSPAFREVLKTLKPLTFIEKKLTHLQTTLQNHPRGRGVVIRKTPHEVFRECARLFQEHYQHAELRSLSSQAHRALQKNTTKEQNPRRDRASSLVHRLQRERSLSEVYLEHPNIPICGYVDVIYKEGEEVVIADYKTGKVHDTHKEQVMLYCLLWWSCTGVVPARAEIYYLNETRCWGVDVETLITMEDEISIKVAHYLEVVSSVPALSLKNDMCSWCDVRQYCDTYWMDISSTKESKDVEVQVQALRGGYGFTGKLVNGEDCAVVYAKDFPGVSFALEEGVFLRITGGQRDEGDIVLRRWSEVFLTKHSIAQI